MTKHQHLAQIRFTEESPPTELSNYSHDSHGRHRPVESYLTIISIDSDHQLSQSQCQVFHVIHRQYKEVFKSDIGKYNDASVKLHAHINIGPVEPSTQKSRQPMYPRKDLNELQGKMDELKHLGVLAKPEDLNIIMEHVSPSFLVKKPGGGSRLVTAFNGIAG